MKTVTIRGVELELSVTSMLQIETRDPGLLEEIREQFKDDPMIRVYDTREQSKAGMDWFSGKYMVIVVYWPGQPLLDRIHNARHVTV